MDESYNLNQYICYLSVFIDSYNKRVEPKKQIDESHGINHMTIVLNHTEQALAEWPGDKIEPKEMFKIKLAALLHDIDDGKYFPDNYNYENAVEILNNINSSTQELSDTDINDIIEMISWVSSSKNGDNIPDKAIGKEYLLYPRYADRLEALGIIGLERTLHYTLKRTADVGKYNEVEGFLSVIPEVLFNSQTLKATSNNNTSSNESYLKNLYQEIATKQRYKDYSKSITMMDHFYDKLLRLGKYPIRNNYFDIETRERQKPLEYVAIEFAKRDNITESELKLLMESVIHGEILLEGFNNDYNEEEND
jgi:uncharacterized protein